MADADDDAFLYGDDTNGSATGDAAQLAGMLASIFFYKIKSDTYISRYVPVFLSRKVCNLKFHL